jgi:hypothetical protein
LKESINAIVRDMMKTAKINIPPSTQPISVFRNIDSLVEAGTTPGTTHGEQGDTPYPADLTLTHELNRTNTLRWDIKEILY